MRRDTPEPETLGDLVAAGRDREGAAMDATGRAAPYSYRDFCTNVWKAGNLLGHYGVHAAGELAVVVGPKSASDESGTGSVDTADPSFGTVDAADPLLAVLGGTLLGATVDVTPDSPVDAPAVVYPADVPVETTPGCSPVAYGGPPDEPAVHHFERELWGENPVEPPEPVDTVDDALRADSETFSHETLLAATADVVDRYDLDGNDRVLLAAPITEPGAFVAGVLAPLSVGATTLVPDPESGDSATSGESDGSASTPQDYTLAVRGKSEEETDERVVSAASVTRSLRDTRRT